MNSHGQIRLEPIEHLRKYSVLKTLGFNESTCLTLRSFQFGT